MNSSDLAYMNMAIEEAAKTPRPEGSARPCGGVVVVKGSEVLARGHSSEVVAGEHAVYTVLERKLAAVSISGATVYSAMEPCTVSFHPKLSCTHRLIERKVHRVVIGMLDPVAHSCGQGLWLLRESGIETDLFPHALASQVEGLNRQFIRVHRSVPRQVKTDEQTTTLAHAINSFAPAQVAPTREDQRVRSPINVFLSYSHLDDYHRDQLDGHLSVLKHTGVIEIWHDGRLLPGAEWRSTISKRLEQADIIVLLVSKDFLASEYCYSKELRRAMERHRVGDATVIPVLVRACDWSLAPFAELQALPPRGLAVMSWSNQDEAYSQVAVGIRQSVENIREKLQRRGA